LDYVSNNDSDVDSSVDKGTHSNFTAQQYGPDSIYDTLTEENTYIVDPSECLEINLIDSNVDADSVGVPIDVTTLATDDDLTVQAYCPRERCRFCG